MTDARSGRHPIGTLAGFKSEYVAGFLLEYVAGFVGIRKMAFLTQEAAAAQDRKRQLGARHAELDTLVAQHDRQSAEIRRITEELEQRHLAQDSRAIELERRATVQQGDAEALHKVRRQVEAEKTRVEDAGRAEEARVMEERRVNSEQFENAMVEARSEEANARAAILEANDHLQFAQRLDREARKRADQQASFDNELRGRAEAIEAEQHALTRWQTLIAAREHNVSQRERTVDDANRELNDERANDIAAMAAHDGEHTGRLRRLAESENALEIMTATAAARQREADQRLAEAAATTTKLDSREREAELTRATIDHRSRQLDKASSRVIADDANNKANAIKLAERERTHAVRVGALESGMRALASSLILHYHELARHPRLSPVADLLALVGSAIDMQVQPIATNYAAKSEALAVDKQKLEAALVVATQRETDAKQAEADYQLETKAFQPELKRLRRVARWAKIAAEYYGDPKLRRVAPKLSTALNSLAVEFNLSLKKRGQETEI